MPFSEPTHALLPAFLLDAMVTFDTLVGQDPAALFVLVTLGPPHGPEVQVRSEGRVGVRPALTLELPTSTIVVVPRPGHSRLHALKLYTVVAMAATTLSWENSTALAVLVTLRPARLSLQEGAGLDVRLGVPVRVRSAANFANRVLA